MKVIKWPYIWKFESLFEFTFSSLSSNTKAEYYPEEKRLVVSDKKSLPKVLRHLERVLEPDKNNKIKILLEWTKR